MEKVEELVTDEQITAVWGNADFGKIPMRSVIAGAVLKYASGYSTGYTIKQICGELRLIGKNGTLTKLGKRYLYAAYYVGVSV